MRVISPKDSNIGFFLRKNRLFVAMMEDGKLDLSTARQFDFFDDNEDWEEAMNALDILKSNHPAWGEMEGFDDEA